MERTLATNGRKEIPKGRNKVQSEKKKREQGDLGDTG